MSISRGSLRDQVLDYADAAGSSRWDAEPGGTVDLRISGVFDRLWRRILNANRFYRASMRTPTSDAVTGRYLVSDLNGGAGDTLQRLYRVLVVIIDGRRYQGPVNLTDQNIATAALVPRGSDFVWYQEGTNLNTLPNQLSKTVDGIWVNWVPARPATLSSDDALIDFPDGYEDVLAVHSAARLLSKGGAETQAGAELRQEVQEDFDEMLQDLARVSTDPLVMRMGDEASGWGAE